MFSNLDAHFHSILFTVCTNLLSCTGGQEGCAPATILSEKTHWDCRKLNCFENVPGSYQSSSPYFPENSQRISLFDPDFFQVDRQPGKQVSEQEQGPSSTSTWFVNSSHPQSTGRRASPQKAWVPTVLGHNPLPLRSESSPETTQMLQQFILQWLAQNDTVPLLSWSLLTCPEWVSSLTENYEEKSHTVPL